VASVRVRKLARRLGIRPLPYSNEKNQDDIKIKFRKKPLHQSKPRVYHFEDHYK
jgi:hypothetical protein